MKIASLVLGIIGGVLAIIIAIVYIAGGAVLGAGTSMYNQAAQLGDEAIEQQLQQANDILKEAGFDEELGDIDVNTYSNIANQANAEVAGLWIAGIAAIIGAILGIIGGAMAKKKGILAGIFMLIAAIPGFFIAFGFIASMLFIVGAVLSFIPEKPAATAPAV